MSIIGLFLEYSRAKSEDLKIEIIKSEETLEDIVPEKYRMVHGGSVVLYDQELNTKIAEDSRLFGQLTTARKNGGASAKLRESDGLLRVQWEPKERPLHFELADRRGQLLLHKYRKAHNRPYNNIVAAQRSSLWKSVNRKETRVAFGPSRYFDLMISNYLAGWNVYDNRSSLIIEGKKLLLTKDGTLYALDESYLSNAVGVSTLAFDKRRRLILIAQSEDALSSPGLWAPSGSGSLEPIDFRWPNGKGDPPLAAVIMKGMNRELCEEANIKYSMIAWSELLGYFRWISKGAKPEYVGITLLNKDASELKRRVRFAEFRYVRKIAVGWDIDFEKLKNNPTDPLAAVDDKYSIRSLASVPLVVGLRALGERLSDETFSSRFLLATSDDGSTLL